MARPNKKTALDANALLGEIAIVRSSIWQNGQRRVAAVITDTITDVGMPPDGAVALVSLTAFTLGAPLRMMRDVPLYGRVADETLFPCAWIKRKD